MKSSLFTFIIAVATALGSISAYAAWYATVAQMSAKVAELESTITSKNQTIARVAATRAALIENKEDTERLAAYSVPQTEVVSFIDFLEGIALSQGTGLEVISVSVEGTKERPVLVMALGIDGSFAALMRTLGTIEYAPYMISFSNVTIANQETKGAWHADVRMRVGSR